MYSANEVIAFIINWCYKNNVSITNLKLQKLLYFIQGEMYRETKIRFIQDDFYVYKLGAVIPKIYNDFSIFSSFQIPRLKKKVNFSDKEILILNKILYEYANKTTWDLVSLSCSEDPCKYTYELFGNNSKISFGSIANYYE